MLNKKGEVPLLEDAKEVILALVVLGALIGIVLLILLPSWNIASEWTCKTSVAWASGTFNIAKRLGFDTIMCYAQDEKSDAKEKEEALNDIAEYMRKCWNMWGEGNLNPEGERLWYWGKEKCFTCYRLNFPELKESVSLEDINNYLIKGERKYSKLAGEQSYWNYFKKSNPANMVGVLLSNTNKEDDVINKDEFYAVVYSENIQSSGLFKGVTIGFVAGAGSCIWFGGPLSAAVCGKIGAVIGGIVSKFSDFDLEDLVNKIRGKVPADGIYFMDYNDAKNKCVTVVKTGKEFKFDGEGEKKSGGAGVTGENF